MSSKTRLFSVTTWNKESLIPLSNQILSRAMSYPILCNNKKALCSFEIIRNTQINYIDISSLIYYFFSQESIVSEREIIARGAAIGIILALDDSLNQFDYIIIPTSKGKIATGFEVGLNSTLCQFGKRPKKVIIAEKRNFYDASSYPLNIIDEDYSKRAADLLFERMENIFKLVYVDQTHSNTMNSFCPFENQTNGRTSAHSKLSAAEIKEIAINLGCTQNRIAAIAY